MKKLISVLALLVIAGLLVSNCYKGRQIDKLAEQSDTLPDRQSARVVVKDNKLTATVRQPDGTVKTQVKYVPPEGKAEVVQPTEGPAEITIKRVGCTFRPAVQGLVGKELKGGLGARLVYFDRYGVGVGLGTDLEGYLFVDRRMDDFTGLLNNTTVGLYGGRGRIGVLVGVYF